MLLHILFFVAVPNFKFDVLKKFPDLLTVELVNPKLPEPEPLLVPEQPKPNEPKPSEPVKPTPELSKPLPKKALTTPKPVLNTKPELAKTEPLQAEPQQPELETPPDVITAEPKMNAPPTITVPPSPPITPSESPKKTEPSQDDINAALDQYSSTLGRAIAKHKQYPKVAQMRGWQGDCLLDLKLDGGGNVLSASVKETSGHEVLDKQALEMARKAAPFPAPPEVLRGRNFNLTVPVSFKLE